MANFRFVFIVYIYEQILQFQIVCTDKELESIRIYRNQKESVFISGTLEGHKIRWLYL